tara:strand:+ start:411 stop:773 length:363 start_codon:yes stop_codon:yes gene_type:complete
MGKLQEDTLVGLEMEVFDFTASAEEKLNESFLRTFGWLAKTLLKKMFGDPAATAAAANLKIKASPQQAQVFSDALRSEKSYMNAFVKYGLNDPRTFNSKWELDTAVQKFERATGLKWPFK